MADVLPQLLERIENIEKQLNVAPANSLSVATLQGISPQLATLEHQDLPAIDASGAAATKLDVANATGQTINPDVQPSTSQPGAPIADVTGDTGSTSGKKSKS